MENGKGPRYRATKNELLFVALSNPDAKTNGITDNPTPKKVVVDAEKANNWIKNGAKPTDTVDRLFRENSVYSAGANSNNTAEASESEATE